MGKTVRVDFEALSSELLCMNDTQAGKFLRLLCMQAGLGVIPDESMRIIAGRDTVVRAMFKKTDNGYQNVRLAEALLQSAAFSESRRENRKAKETAEPPKDQPKKLKYAENVLMTAQEYSQLVGLYGRAASEKFVEVLDNYKGQSGKKYKSDYRAILNWVIKRVESDYPGLVKKFNGAVTNPDENPFN